MYESLGIGLRKTENTEKKSLEIGPEESLVTKKVSELISGENLAPEKSQNRFRSDF